MSVLKKLDISRPLFQWSSNSEVQGLEPANPWGGLLLLFLAWIFVAFIAYQIFVSVNSFVVIPAVSALSSTRALFSVSAASKTLGNISWTNDRGNLSSFECAAVLMDGYNVQCAAGSQEVDSDLSMIQLSLFVTGINSTTSNVFPFFISVSSFVDNSGRLADVRSMCGEQGCYRVNELFSSSSICLGNIPLNSNISIDALAVQLCNPSLAYPLPTPSCHANDSRSLSFDLSSLAVLPQPDPVSGSNSLSARIHVTIRITGTSAFVDLSGYSGLITTASSLVSALGLLGSLFALNGVIRSFFDSFKRLFPSEKVYSMHLERPRTTLSLTGFTSGGTVPLIHPLLSHVVTERRFRSFYNIEQLYGPRFHCVAGLLMGFFFPIMGVVFAQYRCRSIRARFWSIYGLSLFCLFGGIAGFVFSACGYFRAAPMAAPASFFVVFVVSIFAIYASQLLLSGAMESSRKAVKLLVYFKNAPERESLLRNLGGWHPASVPPRVWFWLRFCLRMFVPLFPSYFLVPFWKDEWKVGNVLTVSIAACVSYYFAAIRYWDVVQVPFITLGVGVLESFFSFACLVEAHSHHSHGNTRIFRIVVLVVVFVACICSSVAAFVIVGLSGDITSTLFALVAVSLGVHSGIAFFVHFPLPHSSLLVRLSFTMSCLSLVFKFGAQVRLLVTLTTYVSPLVLFADLSTIAAGLLAMCATDFGSLLALLAEWYITPKRRNL